MKFDDPKWGLAYSLSGHRAVIVEILPDVYVEDLALPIGIELIFTAIGFLTYFFTKDKGKTEGWDDGTPRKVRISYAMAMAGFHR
jgi:hypothetical protein